MVYRAVSEAPRSGQRVEAPAHATPSKFSVVSGPVLRLVPARQLVAIAEGRRSPDAVRDAWSAPQPPARTLPGTHSIEVTLDSRRSKTSAFDAVTMAASPSSPSSLRPAEPQPREGEAAGGRASCSR